jgi:hypothetical protein
MKPERAVNFLYGSRLTPQPVGKLPLHACTQAPDRVRCWVTAPPTDRRGYFAKDAPWVVECRAEYGDGKPGPGKIVDDPTLGFDLASTGMVAECWSEKDARAIAAALEAYYGPIR